MTEVNGLRLAYRGFVTGIAGAYVWAAIAMALAAIAHGDPMAPLRPVATAITPLAGTPELAFVLGLAAIQAGGALIGMVFAYFFARFFTVRSTLGVAGPVVAMLVWAMLVAVFERTGSALAPEVQLIGLMATIGFGLVLGASVPVRGDVTRYSGSAST